MAETATVTEKKNELIGELGWNFAALFFLLMGAIGIIYGWDYKGMGYEILVPSFVSLILACFAEIKSIGARLP